MRPTDQAATALFTLVIALAGCGLGSLRTGGGYQPEGDGGTSDDISFAFGSDGSTGYSGPCDDQHACPTGQLCFQGACYPNNGTCTSDDQCEDDTYCECVGGGGGDAGACVGGICLPWGDGPRGTFSSSCLGAAFSPSQFESPITHCSWTDTGDRGWVVMTPLLIDLDQDGKPEILFSPMGGSGGQYAQRIVALKTDTCSVLFDIDANLEGFSQLAAGDLDGDKIPEIVGLTSSKTVQVFNNKGALLASSSTPYSFSSGGSFDCSGPAIVNADQVGNAEIVVGGQVLRYTKGQAALTPIFTQPASAGSWGTLTAAADLDGDGHAEIITGLEVYDGVTGAVKTPSVMKGLGAPGGYPAIADFNGDKKPDIVVVQSATGMQKVSVIDFTNDKIIFGPYTVAGGGWGGPPTVADFDGDGVPDFGLSSSTSYYVYSMKCAKNPKPADCTGSDPGVLWQKATHDVSSGGTASSVFDFNGDGKAEVVYRDECWLRVYNGPDGKTVFAANITSGTALENPIIGDVDGDGHADIVVGSDDIQASFTTCPESPEAETGVPWTGYTRGLFVLRDPMNRWMPSRGLWNEHTYHITNVNDDLTIPLKEATNWTSWNDYRQNVQGVAGAPAALPDATSGAATGIDPSPGDCQSTWNLRANICNRGTAAIAAGLPGTFYSSDPSKANPMSICTTATTGALNPGQCETVSCDWKNPPQNAVDIWFRADDAGTGAKAPVNECNPDNDTLYLPQQECMKIG